MSGLKLLRNRIKSVKSTQKITKAMKMVAASKLRRAKEAAEAARPYAKGLEGILSSVAGGQSVSGSPLLSGTGSTQRQLLIVATSDRGLCGAFNSSIVRASRRKIRELVQAGHEVSIITVGRKGYDQLVGEFGKYIVLKLTDIGRKRVSYVDAEVVAKEILSRFDAGDYDVATIVYNHFKSAISQVVTFQQLVPLNPAGGKAAAQDLGVKGTDPVQAQSASQDRHAPYKFEPSESEILDTLLPKNLTVQVFNALLENAASEQGARMTAMDNASRNAGDMIKKLNLKYNRSRQATITKELIEIISGAEAV